MANEEKTILNRIITQLKTIDGTSGWNTDISDYVEDEFFQLEKVNRFPMVCVAGIDMAEADPRRRKYFELPLTIELMGYAKDDTNPLNATLDLLSDIRRVITQDEHLNSLVTQLTFSYLTGVYDGKGLLSFSIHCRGHIKGTD